MHLEGSSGSLIKALSWDFPGGTEGNNDKLVRIPGVPTKITPPEYEPRTPLLYASQSAQYSTFQIMGSKH
jgi:hypothetical protein